MKISFAILTHNEGRYIENLLNQLLSIKKDADEIVIVDDFSDDPITVEILNRYREKGTIQFSQHELNSDFSQQKNYLNSLCTGDWIVNLDADELLTDDLAMSLHELLEMNPNVDAIWIPRINIVKGLTGQHVSKWNWRVDSDGHVNFPDWQLRIYKNSKELYWIYPVHEILVGYKTVANLPDTKDLAILHEKTINMQENSVKLYQEINPNVQEKI